MLEKWTTFVHKPCRNTYNVYFLTKLATTIWTRSSLVVAVNVPFFLYSFAMR